MLLQMCFTRSHHRRPALEKFINSTEEMLSDPCSTTARWCLHQQKVSSLSNLGKISRQQLFPKKRRKKFSFSAAPETERIPLKLSSGTSLKVFLEFFSRLRSRDSWFLRREGEEWKEDKTEFLSRVKSCCLAVARECCWEEIERMRGCLGGWCCKASKLLWSFFSICRNDSLLTAICWWRGAKHPYWIANEIDALGFIRFSLHQQRLDLIKFLEAVALHANNCARRGGG